MSSSSARRRVVVTGCGVVSPIGVGRQEFFAGLREGRSGIGPIRSFDAATFPTRIAGQVPPLPRAELDLPADQRAALLRDPKSLFGLLAGREALAQAFPGSRASAHHAPRRVGLVLAAGLEIFNLGDLAEQVRAGRLDYALLAEAVRAQRERSLVQIPADLGARCLAAELGGQGLFAVNLSACAAGSQAIGEAFLAVQDGLLDCALTGGYDSMVNPLGVGGFCMLEALSRSNELGPAASRPFDRARDGFVLGEGAAALVLEEREAARRRGAPILAELRGYASTLDAFRVSDPAPDQAQAARAMRLALERAGIAPGELDYINAHGTGTRKNDPSEAAAIRQVLGQAAPRVPVSSTKSQLGHLIGAAGAVELVAVLWALEAQLLPATLNLTDPDPECALCHVPLAPRSARVRTCLSNSFGFGGQNAALVVSRSPA
ncbi:MAG TPA: beta-ketoacyl-[acyl-carrier-protein] synthase family protein [Myxococcota bacterium]|nr:beta-ketoacyl-[acyl-carrier-protein] synthase family protein [Myxococcota bacterium]HRY95799.1 beta-ketoacyl-[acyl-carrier-protein] synthase family protein [Myxococcota bacterium]HSA23410.1 beta-ketoacyl-[acyl-carrier-protein] synthase family protein [Myxococcota bacterium]